MFAALKKNIYPAIALMIIPCGYYAGTVLREKEDAKKLLSQIKTKEETEEDLQKLRQQLEALKEEREIVLSKINKTE